MAKRIGSLLFLLISVAFHVYSGGRSEKSMVSMLKNDHNIFAVPISRHEVYDYVVTNAKTVIYSEDNNLYEYNITTGEKKKIPFPQSWVEFQMVHITKMSYDDIENTIYMRITFVQNRTTDTFYRLYVDTNTWEEIPELSNYASNMWIYHYSHERKTLYFIPIRGNNLYIFDMGTRTMRTQTINIPEEEYLIIQEYIIYEKPLSILLRISPTRNREQYYLCIYNVENETADIITDTNFISNNVDFSKHLFNAHYIPLGEHRFLGLSAVKGNTRNIHVLDLADKNNTVASLADFEYPIYYLKKCPGENKFSFLIRSDTFWTLSSFGVAIPRLVCFFTIDEGTGLNDTKSSL